MEVIANQDIQGQQLEMHMGYFKFSKKPLNITHESEIVNRLGTKLPAFSHC